MIGANAVVLDRHPAGSTAVGMPARVVRRAAGGGPAMNDVGVVAIGRNEGERLRRCLDSLGGPGRRRRLRRLGLDRRQRRAGPVDGRRGGRARHVPAVLGGAGPGTRASSGSSEIAPGVRYVQFLDGDCEVADGWLDRARRELEARPEAAVVCGRRREMFPEHSIYNRLADLEWDTPIGEAVACGGDSMIRAEAFEAVGGFDPTAAGRRGARALPAAPRRPAGRVWRVDAEMTWHDLGMTRFRQWWRRQYRSGYNGLDIVTRFPRRGPARSPRADPRPGSGRSAGPWP